MTRQSLIVGKDRFIIGPWHDDETTAYVRMDPSTNSVPNVDSVQQCMSYLHESGFERALTAALRAPEADVFQHAGFTLNERLHILKHDLRGDLTGTDHRLRRARRNDRPTVLRLDHLAFDDFWHLGAEGLNEALNATTTARSVSSTRMESSATRSAVAPTTSGTSSAWRCTLITFAEVSPRHSCSTRSGG
jgi:hypothetical protein